MDPATDQVIAIGNFSMNDVLIQATDGMLYGTDAYGGADGSIFRINTSTLGVEVVHTFTGLDGSTPYGRLCQAGNGKLYGLTFDGGTDGDGVLYQYDPVTDVHTKLLDLTGPNGADPWTGFIRLSSDLLLAPITLGGTNGSGALMQLQPSTGQTTLVHSFSTSVDGGLLFGGIVQATNGMVYGMASSGGTWSAGTIYGYDAMGQSVTTLHSFDGGADGRTPRGELVVVGDGTVGLSVARATAHAWRVWPNPAQGSTTLQCADERFLGAPLTLRDMAGRIVWEGRLSSLEQNVPLPASSGTYVLSGAAEHAVLQVRILVP